MKTKLIDCFCLADMVILVKLVCCNECLIQYMNEKKTCFLCNAAIEEVEGINVNISIN
jgi:hypothetical protein